MVLGAFAVDSMNVLFINDSLKVNEFFDLLPIDWQQSIVPYWKDYKNDTEVYLLVEENKVVGGGLVFSRNSPDMLSQGNIAEKYFQQGYKYIAYLWISQNHRSKGYGKYWLQKLQHKNPMQRYWLTIEEQSLLSFYEKLGFSLYENICNEGVNEWVLATSPQK